jgi:GT2 family glycosyltransferase
MRPLFDPDHGEPVEVEAVSGACQMIRREVFEKVGLFSTDYFMYMEDLDLCYKVGEIGEKVSYFGSATVVHHGGQSSKKRGGENFSGPMMKESVLKFLRKILPSLHVHCFSASDRSPGSVIGRSLGPT